MEVKNEKREVDDQVIIEIGDDMKTEDIELRLGALGKDKLCGDSAGLSAEEGGELTADVSLSLWHQCRLRSDRASLGHSFRALGHFAIFLWQNVLLPFTHVLRSAYLH